MTTAHHLNVVGEAGEDEARDDEDHDQEPQLWNTLTQSEHNGLQTPGVSEVIHNTRKLYIIIMYLASLRILASLKTLKT